MKREIKFRAWDKEKKLMLYGIQNTYDTVKAYTLSDGAEIDQADTSFWRARSFGEFIERWPDVLMQFTGLKDKNGKEIYEGDILLSEGEKTTIEWEEWIDRDRFWSTASGFGITFDRAHASEDEIEVIGNIYENVDLLEK